MSTATSLPQINDVSLCDSPRIQQRAMERGTTVKGLGPFIWIRSESTLIFQDQLTRRNRANTGQRRLLFLFHVLDVHIPSCTSSPRIKFKFCVPKLDGKETWVDLDISKEAN